MNTNSNNRVRVLWTRCNTLSQVYYQITKCVFNGICFIQKCQFLLGRAEVLNFKTPVTFIFIATPGENKST